MSDIIVKEGGLSRRQVLQWMAAVGAAASGVAGGGNAAGPSGSVGYGNDPLLVSPPRQPWPKILLAKQQRALAMLVDVILPARGDSPAASEVGVVLFFEEWLSAPYPKQLADRELLLPLLDAHAAGIPAAALQSWKAWERLRLLTGSAYYTTPVGMREMGWRGNIPQLEFKGPPPDVLELLEQRYAALD